LRCSLCPNSLSLHLHLCELLAAVDRSAERPGASVSKETIRRIADRVVEEMQSWQARPQEEVQHNHYRRRALSVGTLTDRSLN
jgi:hypothetical protein